MTVPLSHLTGLSMQFHAHSVALKLQSQFCLTHSNTIELVLYTQLQSFTSSWKMFGVLASLHCYGVQLAGVFSDGVIDGIDGTVSVGDGHEVVIGAEVVGTTGTQSVGTLLTVGGSVGGRVGASVGHSDGMLLDVTLGIGGRVGACVVHAA